MPDIRTIATSIVRKLNDAGYVSYFAGGWVRDKLLNLPSPDIDIATEAPPEVVIELFPRTVKVGAAFGVVMVIEEGVPFEIATFRRDGLYVSGRRPESVEYSTAEEDAERRDFTINGMFYDPIEDKVIDFVDGKKDLERRLVRAIGDANARFEEDRLRMVRAVRIVARFDFDLDDATRTAIVRHAPTLFPPVAQERVWQELNKMSVFPGFDRAILLLQELKLFQEIFPELKELSREQLQQRTAAFARFPKDCPTVLYLSQLYFDHDLSVFIDVCQRLHTANRDIKLAMWQRKVSEMLQRDLVEPLEWVRLYADERTQLCLDVCAATLAQEQADALRATHKNNQEVWEAAIERARTRRPLVSSEHLKDLGIVPGKLMGQLLDEGESIAVTQAMTDPEAVLKLLKDSPLWPTDSAGGGQLADD